MSIIQELKSRFKTALSSFTDDPDQYLDMIRSSQDPKFGDFQANFAMPLAKRMEGDHNPREVAQKICDAVDVSGLCELPEVAGPGFINLKLRDEWLQSQLADQLDDDRCGVAAVSEPKHFIVDFSSPNVAKPMHVGHLRSTVIGDAICRILRFLGHKVTSDNHIGDWGTQFGMIIYGYKNFVDEPALADDVVTELSRLYRVVNKVKDYQSNLVKLPRLQAELAEKQALLDKQEQEADPSDKKAKKALKKLRATVKDFGEKINGRPPQGEDDDGEPGVIAEIAAFETDPVLPGLAAAHPDIAVSSRNETAKLHKGDEENLALWNRFLPECLKTLQAVYDRLGIEFDLTLGESFYQPKLEGVVTRLKEANLAKESEGAVCVFLDGNEAPFIVQKGDGAYTYGTTDLATIEHRVQELNADEALYVVDVRQSEHFENLFETADKWNLSDIKLRHVKFGTVMDKKGKPYKTRSGDTVGLMGLLDEAVSRAGVIVDANDTSNSLDGPTRQVVAETVGLGGVKYVDLSHDRESDYQFDWKKMLAVTGNTAAYVQYAYARINGIATKGGVDQSSLSGTIRISDQHERSLAIQLARFGDAVRTAASDFRPHLLTQYLFETAKSYSAFFENCPVLKAEDDAIRTSRLLLCQLTARVLKQGLALLGITTAERM